MSIDKHIFLMMAVCMLAVASIAGATEIIESHAISMRGEPKYPADFTHFDYVNPDAPKGGTLTLSAIGTYDSFHRYAQRGNAADASDDLYDTLLVSSDDEVEVYYGLIAEKMTYPTDYTWIVFHLNPNARFQDGTPITAEDVVFSFNTFFHEGVPQFKQYYKDVEKVDVLEPHQVKFTLKEGNKELLISLGGLRVLPKHYWEDKDFSEPMTDVPVGSGPYTISEYKIGQYVVYKRIDDYWAADLPVMKGRNNFEYMRYDYYRDQTVAFEAFKAGEYDFRQENISKNWATQYTGPQFDKGYIVKEEIEHEIPIGMQSFVFNIQRPFFQDRRVRMALGYAMDFEWMNKNLFYDQYTRTRSYFQNTKYEAKGFPSEEELKILEPFRGKIPDEVFTKEYMPPKTDGSGNIRTQLRQALRLLQEAGWMIKDKKLVHAETNEPFEFELLLYSPSMERVAIPIQKNMERMGVTMNIRVVDTTQFVNRMRNRDYDMISYSYTPSHYPDSNLKIIWRSDYLDYTYNAPGVQDDVVDALVDGIEASQDDEEMLLHYGRAFDRVLTWNHYVIPEWHISKFRVAYWNKFSRPKIRPKYALGLDTWWVDPDKEQQLPQRNM
ncbi:ABC transporter substrate-binding protein [candidate division KSB3 bacterium]|uniref:ABC transporter substrate-binding protein n=1 Tax=candidate division KSB3 bacterium TaxID=2044937 RepID=A0A2G6KIS4_9BACT|nr:MAG: ABC transporter substrate-binding protein [candidate division KSB3 bacterium]